MRLRASALALVFLVICAPLASETVHAAWFATPSSELPATPLPEWTPASGDILIADTKENVGYLVHRNGGFTTFPIASGQRKVVRYIGRVYNAATPNRSWISRSKEVKGDRITFGSEGTFFRLSYDGEGTSYGIHTHAYAQAMLSSAMRYRSMGCIIVTTDVLSVIETTFAGNDEELRVLTVNGFGDDGANAASLHARALETENL